MRSANPAHNDYSFYHDEKKHRSTAYGSNESTSSSGRMNGYVANNHVETPELNREYPLPPTAKSRGMRKKKKDYSPVRYMNSAKSDEIVPNKLNGPTVTISDQEQALHGSNIVENDMNYKFFPSEKKSLLQANSPYNVNGYDSYREEYLDELEKQREDIKMFSHLASYEYAGYEEEEEKKEDEEYEEKNLVLDRVIHFFYEDVPLYTKWIYNEKNPEFTEQQQIVWSIIIGIFMGVFTALWSDLVEFCVEFVWKDIPEKLYELGLFTDLDGPRPLPHYMWVCPAFFGGILSLITAKLPVVIPGQNEWIESLHRKGLMDHETCIYIFLISTAGMASGLSLGPELPLVLTAGMIGSYFAKITRQSVLSTRVLNLTAASAAIGGFFGFPMAGALFVLELPHRKGLQYYEALNPAVLASIFAVITNRIVTRNDVKGYFDYPFLKDVLPSHIFYIAVLYGIVGGLFGILYVEGSIKLKTVTHDLFHFHEDHDDHHEENDEGIPLIRKATSNTGKTKKTILESISSFSIKNEPLRATIVGTIAGALVGVISMYYPINLFWGEAQLQTLIDNGTTQLPIFGRGEEITADLTAYGHCMSNAEADFQFSVGCSAIFVITKIMVIGLSLGTGIIGGHFWGPLYVGAAAGNVFNGLMRNVVEYFGIGHELSSYPCLAIICIMGSTHVVTFKAHMAIILILTLTITSFNPSKKTGEDNDGDFAAVFPLLTVSCFISLWLTNGTVYYKKQGHRGDITVTDQALCEPGKFGAPIVSDKRSEDEDQTLQEENISEEDERLSEGSLSIPENEIITNFNTREMENHREKRTTLQTSITQDEIERSFAQMSNNFNAESNIHASNNPIYGRTRSVSAEVINNSGLDELAKLSTNSKRNVTKHHRRARSEGVKEIIGGMNSMGHRRTNSATRRNRADSPGSDRSRRITRFGEIRDDEMQPPLLEQARQRAASKDSCSPTRSRVPRSHSHRRNWSLGSDYSAM